jgi:hypothetical protein
MFTATQAATVKQLVIKQFKQFVTQDQLAAMYALDHSQYEEIVAAGDFSGSYAAYFSEMSDPYAQIQFLDMVAEPVMYIYHGATN